tara:strand:+ start:775 stop:1050 length:276 start_codon:yes stop_codon:yes gene_type:complete
MSRWIVGMSGNKDAMIRHLEKCEDRMLKQFAEIREIAHSGIISENGLSSLKMKSIVELCNVYLDKRSDMQKLQDEMDELKEQVRRLTEGDE